MNPNPYIEAIKVNLFDGVFSSEIKFKNGLNIISGENGTGKTQLIQLLKNGPERKFYSDIPTERVVVFNPFRNSEKRNLEEIINKLRSQGTSKKTVNDFLKQINIQSWQFQPYPSFAELFVISYEELINNKEITKGKAIQEIQDTFNEILSRIFPNYYKLSARWDYKTKQLLFFLKKYGTVVVPIESISHGENELFSLIFSLFSTKEDEDIYLIDEPELHLNWELERNLFRFLNWFCENYNKQIILATHSRVIFEAEFLPKTQFLIWDNGKIVIKDHVTSDIKDKIGGEALQLVTALDIKKPVFYVEDNEQRQVVKFLAEFYSKDIYVFKVPGKGNVENLCQYFTEQKTAFAFFLEDGDNEGMPTKFKGNKLFIKLKKYCIENYFLDIFILSKMGNKTDVQIKKLIKQSIAKAKKRPHSLVFEILATEKSDMPPNVLDTYNAKWIINSIAKGVGLNSGTKFIEKFLEVCKAENRLEIVFKEITKIIKKITP